MAKVYFISGLGADERVFARLPLPGWTTVHLKWIPPQPRESLPQYARRLIEQIDTREDVILIGVSFGGIMAQEIARQVACRRVILISSVKSPEELHPLAPWLSRTGLHRLLPAGLLKIMSRWVAPYFFSVDSAAERQLLRTIIGDTDKNFVQWAVAAVLHWPGLPPTPGVIHLHGTRDRIFPIHRIKNAMPIADGGHFMVLNRAEEISRRIREVLE